MFVFISFVFLSKFSSLSSLQGWEGDMEGLRDEWGWGTWCEISKKSILKLTLKKKMSWQMNKVQTEIPLPCPSHAFFSSLLPHPPFLFVIDSSVFICCFLCPFSHGQNCSLSYRPIRFYGKKWCIFSRYPSFHCHCYELSQVKTNCWGGRNIYFDSIIKLHKNVQQTRHRDVRYWSVCQE